MRIRGIASSPEIWIKSIGEITVRNMKDLSDNFEVLREQMMERNSEFVPPRVQSKSYTKHAIRM
jgi:hypothetical protein